MKAQENDEGVWGVYKNNDIFNLLINSRSAEKKYHDMCQPSQAWFTEQGWGPRYLHCVIRDRFTRQEL